MSSTSNSRSAWRPRVRRNRRSAPRRYREWHSHEPQFGQIAERLTGAGISSGDAARGWAHPIPQNEPILKSMTLLLNNEEVEKALIPAETIAATESVYRELAEGVAFNRPRTQVYLPVESNANPGFRNRSKWQE